MNASMQGRVISLALALLLPVLFSSCGGGLGSTAGGGIGGTGVGPVTGFGSVIVNGVKYDDTGIDGTNFFDDHGRTKAGLKSGMMVAIFGSINGVNGTADNITVLRHADGPMDDNGADPTANTLKVMGQDVVVDTSTVFDNGITNLTDLRNLQGANVNHPELEVQGCADNNGVIHATYIYLWSNDRITGREVQVRGSVAVLDTEAKTFVVGRKTVNFAGVPGGLPAGVVAGSFVEARGTIRVSDNVLLATSAMLEDATGGQPSGSRVEVEGYILRVVTPNASFEVLGPNGVQTVTWTTGTTSFQDGTPADILAGVKVEVEGVRKPDKTLASTKIEIRRTSNIKFETTVTNPQPSSLTLFGVTVKVNALTQYKDDSRVNLKTFGQANILVGNTLEVSAFLDNTTVPASIVATRVERIDPIGTSSHILQGPVGSKANPTLTILGVTVTTTATGTAFLQEEETTFPGATPVDRQNAFFGAVTPGKTIVKSRGQFASGGFLANEVQIEPSDDD